MSTTPACEIYAPNPFILQDVEKLLLPLAHVIQKLPVNVLPLLTDVIANEKANRKLGFSFMEKVAYKYAGTAQEKFISDYTIARVYSTCDEDSVYLISGKGFKIIAPASSLIKYDNFEEMRKEMKLAGKVVNPSVPNPSVKQKYGIPESLDEVRTGKPDGMEFDRKVKKVLLNSNLAERVEKEMYQAKNKRTLKEHLRALKTQPQSNEEPKNFRVSRTLRSADNDRRTARSSDNDRRETEDRRTGKQEKLVSLSIVDFSPKNPKETGKLKSAKVKSVKLKPKKKATVQKVETGKSGLAALAQKLQAKAAKKKK
jgi:hypothetical protein